MNPVPRPSPEDLQRFLASRGPFAFLDFEFNHSQDPVLNLVSCSLQWADEEGQLSDPVEWWLHRDPEAQEDLRQALESMREAGATLVGYGMAAEARSLLSLGIDPHQFPIVDLFAEWRQLTHNNHECEYGTYFTETGFRRFSIPPKFQKSANKGKDNGKVGAGLVAAVGQVFGIFLDSVHKNAMRDLILQDLPSYSEEQRGAIVSYCSGDIHYLPELFFELTRRLQRATRGQLTPEEIKRAQLKRGAFIASTAKMEAEGFPVNVEQIRNLRRNFEGARDTILQDLVENHFPFYVREKKRASDLRGTWTAKASAFEEFLRSRGLLEKWPRTVDEETGRPTDRLSTEDKVLAEFDGVPEIRAFRQARKLVTQLRWFQEPDAAHRKKDGDFFDSIGHDDRQRVFLGPYGTQTSRNAPKASRFILAMSSWLRVLIQPPPGWKVYGIDWASQEFALAAILSGDPAMQEAYRSGDPYLYFAKRAGAVPNDADPSWCKTPQKAGERKDEFEVYKEKRGLFKSCFRGDTLIRVRGVGYKPIAKITQGDYLWDGMEWVPCSGIIPQGIRRVVQFRGTWATPDHEILLKGGTFGTIEAVTRSRGEVSEKEPFRPQRPGSSWAEVFRLGCHVIRMSNPRWISLRGLLRWFFSGVGQSR